MIREMNPTKTEAYLKMNNDNLTSKRFLFKIRNASVDFQSLLETGLYIVISSHMYSDDWRFFYAPIVAF